MKAVAPQLGIRETRRIRADFSLRVADLRDGPELPDTVGFSMYGWDLPDPHKPSVQPLVDESTGKYIDKVQIIRGKIAAAEVPVSRLKARRREVGAIVDRQALPVIPPRQDT